MISAMISFSVFVRVTVAKYRILSAASMLRVCEAQIKTQTAFRTSDANFRLNITIIEWIVNIKNDYVGFQNFSLATLEKFTYEINPG